MAFTGSVTGTMQLRVAESGALHFEGDQGSLLTITDDLSDSLFSVNDAAGMPVFEVFADDTIKSYRNNESKLEIDPDNNRIRLRDNTYISGDLIVSGDITSTSASHESTSYTASTHVSGLSGYFGKVGVGAAINNTNNAILDIQGAGTATLNVRNQAGSSNSTIHLGEQNTSLYGVELRYEGNLGNAFLDNKYNHSTRPHIYFRMKTSRTDPIEAMAIAPNGYLGVGDFSNGDAEAMLQVSGDASITGELRVDDNLLFVDAANDVVGIGTSASHSNAHVLQLHKDTGGVNMLMSAGNYGTNIARLELDSISVGISAGNKVRALTILHSNQNVGIGTSNPGQLLQMYSSAPVFSIKDGGTYGTNATPYMQFDDGNASISRIGKLVDGNAVGLDLQSISGHIHLNPAENVGIGTSSPATILEVLGADPMLTIRDTETAVGSAIAKLRLAESNDSDAVNNTWDICLSGTSAGVNLDFIRTNAGTKNMHGMTIMYDGTVGIGTATTNGSKFLVNGDASISGELRVNDDIGVTGYMLEEAGRQQHVSNTLPQPYYWLDGAATSRIVGTTSSKLNFVGLTEMTMMIRFKVGPTAGLATPYLFAWFADASNSIIIAYPDVSSSDIPWVRSEFAGSAQTDNMAGLPHNSDVNVIVLTVSGSTYSVYSNGKFILTFTGADMANCQDVNGKAHWGESGGSYWEGSIYQSQIWNKVLTASEIKEISSGGSVPRKYKGASNTDLIEANDPGSGTDWTGANDTINGTAPDGWDSGGTSRKYTIDASSGSGAEPALKITAGTGNAWIRTNFNTTQGKRYRLKFIYKNTAGDTAQYSVDGGSAFVDLANTTSWSSVQSIEFTGTGGEDVLLAAKASGDIVWFDNVSLTQIGAVAEYDGSSMTAGTWYDKSGNDLHATPNDTTFENRMGALVVDNVVGIGTSNTDGSMLRVDGDVGITGEIRGNNNVVIPDGQHFKWSPGGDTFIHGSSASDFIGAVISSEQFKIDSTATQVTGDLRVADSIGIACDPSVLLDIRGNPNDPDWRNNNSPSETFGARIFSNRFTVGCFSALEMIACNATTVQGVGLVAQSHSASSNTANLYFTQKKASTTDSAMSLSYDGKLLVGEGIGQTAMFTVSGDASISGELRTKTPLKVEADTPTSDAHYFKMSYDNSAGILDANRGKLQLQASDGVIYTDGDSIGIGTANPGEKLEIYGNGAGLRFEAASTDQDPSAVIKFAENSTDNHFRIEYDGTSNHGANGSLIFGGFGATQSDEFAVINREGQMMVGNFHQGINGKPQATFTVSGDASITGELRIDGNVGIGVAPLYELDISASSGPVEARLYRNANVKSSLRFQNSVQHWEIGNSISVNNEFSIYDHTDSRTAFHIDTLGNVGIGTSNPLYSAHLKAAEATMAIDSTTVSNRVYLSLTNKATNDYFYFGKNGGTHNLITNGGSQPYAHVIGAWGNSDPIQFATNNTVRMSLIDLGAGGLNRGRLLIGEGIGGDGALLTVSGDASISGDISLGGGGSSVAASLKFVNDNERSRITSNYDSGGGGRLGFWTDTAGGSLLQRVTIKNDGKVGISITNPSALLHVEGTSSTRKVAIFESDYNDTNPTDVVIKYKKSVYGGLNDTEMTRLSFEGVDNSAASETMGRISTYLTDQTAGSTDAAMAFSTIRGNTLTEAVRIDADGNVGIGTTVPTGRMHIYQSGDAIPAFLVEGSQGSLFSVEDSLTGSLMSVNDIAGLPVFEAFDDGTIVMGQYNSGDFIVTGNKVGIGMASEAPSYNLHIKPANGNARFKLESDNNAADVEMMLDSASSTRNAHITFYNAGTQKGGVGYVASDTCMKMWGDNNPADDHLVIKSNGSIGIGTTDVAGSRLRVNGDVGISGELRTNGDVGVAVEPNVGGASTNNSVISVKGKAAAYCGVIELINHGSVGDGNSLGRIRFFDNASENAEIEVVRESAADDAYMRFKTKEAGGSLTSRLTIKSNGNVGIGTSNPAEKLEVYGNANSTITARAENANAGNDAKARLEVVTDAGSANFTAYSSAFATSNQNVADSALIQTSSMDGGLGFSTLNSAPIRFWTDSSEKMRLTPAGNVGIGTALPSGVLHVNNAGTGIIVANEHITGNAFEVHGAQGNLLTITDDLSDSLMSVNDAAGMPVFEVFADDTIKSYRNNESKFEVDPDNNRIRLRDNTYISGHTTISGNSLTIGTTSSTHFRYLDFTRSSTHANPTARIRVSEPGALHTSDIKFYTSDAAGGVPNLLEAMIIDSSQNVGIGTTDVDGSKLRVDGDVGITGDLLVAAHGLGANKGARINDGGWGGSYAAFSHASLAAGASSTDYALMQNSAGATLLNCKAGQYIALRVGNANKVVLNAAGEFEVTGALKLDGALYDKDGSKGTNGQVLHSDGSQVYWGTDDSGGGGISWDGSTANGVATYKDADEATVESNLTFDGTDLYMSQFVKHLSDTNTHMGFKQNDHIVFRTAGTDRVLIDDQGHTSVTGRLRVNGQLLPSTDDDIDMGSSSMRWQDIHTMDLHIHGAADYGSVSLVDTRFLVFDANNYTVDYLNASEIIYGVTVTVNGTSSTTASHGGYVDFRVTVNGKQSPATPVRVTWPSS